MGDAGFRYEAGGEVPLGLPQLRSKQRMLLSFFLLPLKASPDLEFVEVWADTVVCEAGSPISVSYVAAP